MRRLHQYSKGKRCYFCGAPGPSTPEHAPPKAFFKGFDCDRITVPSCAEHNASKSNVDQLLLIAQAAAANETMNQGLRKDDPELQAFFATVLASKEQLRKKLWMERPIEGENTELPFIKGENPFLDWAPKLTAAVTWSVLGDYDPLIRWEDSWCFSLAWMRKPITRDKAVEKAQTEKDYFGGLKWMRGWSASPRPYPANVYRFDVASEFDARTKSHLMSLRHAFFGSLIVYVRVPATKDVIERIAEWTPEESDQPSRALLLPGEIKPRR